MELKDVSESSTTVEPEILSDPKELVRNFLESDRYLNAYNEFYSGKNVRPDISEKEKEAAFLRDEKAKIAFLDFSSQDVRFKFDFSRYTDGAYTAIKEYLNLLKDIREKERAGDLKAGDILWSENERSAKHNTAAEQLVADGVVPTAKIGRALVELIAVDKGLDTIENAKRSDYDRNRYELGNQNNVYAVGE